MNSSNARQIHDAAFQMAQAILGTVKQCLYEQEHREAFEEFYRICKQELESYETERARMLQRLRPMSN